MGDEGSGMDIEEKKEERREEGFPKVLVVILHLRYTRVLYFIHFI